jgi:hypothetical protein
MRAIAVIVLPIAVGAASGCVESQRALGEACLKDQDCLSGICSQLQCAATPPVLDATAPPPVADTGAPDTFVAADAPPDTTSAPDVAAMGEASADSASPLPDSSADSGGDSSTADATSD